MRSLVMVVLVVDVVAEAGAATAGSGGSYPTGGSTPAPAQAAVTSTGPMSATRRRVPIPTT